MIADRGSPYCSSEDPPHRRGWHRLGLTAGTSTGVWRVRTYERGCGGRSAGRKLTRERAEKKAQRAASANRTGSADPRSSRRGG